MRREFNKKRIDKLQRLLEEAGKNRAGKKTELVERPMSASNEAAAAKPAEPAEPAEPATDDGVAASEPCPNSNADGIQGGVDLGSEPVAAKLSLHQAPSGAAYFNGKLAPYSILRGKLEHQVLSWLQDDPTFPKRRDELERRYKYDGT